MAHLSASAFTVQRASCYVQTAGSSPRHLFAICSTTVWSYCATRRSCVNSTIRRPATMTRRGCDADVALRHRRRRRCRARDCGGARRLCGVVAQSHTLGSCRRRDRRVVTTTSLGECDRRRLRLLSDHGVHDRRLHRVGVARFQTPILSHHRARRSRMRPNERDHWTSRHALPSPASRSSRQTISSRARYARPAECLESAARGAA